MVDLGHFLTQDATTKKPPFGVPVILAGPHLQVKGAVDEIRASAGDAFYEVAIMLCIPGKVCLSFFEKRDKIIIVQVQILLSGFWFFRRAPTSTRRSRSSS